MQFDGRCRVSNTYILHCNCSVKSHFCTVGLHVKQIFDLLWRKREQVARQTFLLSCTVYCMTNIGPTLCIQPDNTHTIHAVHSRVTPFVIVKVSFCISNKVPQLLDRNSLSDCIGNT